MPRTFSMATVLRRTPYKALRWFLPKVLPDLDFDWENLRACDVDSVLASFESLPTERKSEIEKTVEDVVSLANIEGVAALNEAAKICKISYWDIAFKAYSSTYLKAIYAWSAHHEVFETAKTILQLNRPAYGRKRTGLPVGVMPFTDDKLAELKRALQLFFVDKENRGRVCTVEAFERENGKFSIIAYPDDHEIPKLYHDDREELRPRMDRSVFEVFFAVDTVEGTLELAAKMSKPLKEELEDLFIRTIYGMAPPPAISPTYEIDAMKYPTFPMPTDPADGVRVEIAMMSVKWEFHKRATEFNVERGDHIHESVACYQSRKELTLENAALKRIRIRFYFEHRQDRRAGMVTAELCASSKNCIINCKDSAKVEIIYKCLRNWGVTQNGVES